MSSRDKARVSKSEILEIIKESPVPIGNFDICEIIEGGGKKPTTHSDERSRKIARKNVTKKWKTNVSNHLKNLMDDGLIGRGGQKYVSTQLVDKLEKIENSIKKSAFRKRRGGYTKIIEEVGG